MMPHWSRLVFDARLIMRAARPCTAADNFANCNFKQTDRLDACHAPGGCLHQLDTSNPAEDPA